MLTGEWQAEQPTWMRFVRDGGRLEEVPEPHRSDKVCYFASKVRPANDRSALEICKPQGLGNHQLRAPITVYIYF